MIETMFVGRGEEAHFDLYPICCLALIDDITYRVHFDVLRPVQNAE